MSLACQRPDVFLNVGSDRHARQTGRVMIGFDEVVQANRPDLVIVAGDVNSTLAAALVAAKECIPLAHIEAGLRSFDRSMPEEINRIVTDHLSDFLFITEESADTNLRAEGIDSRRVHFVGNCMVDSLLKHLNRALEKAPWFRFGLKCNEYALVTLHRPSNVDSAADLASIVETLNEASKMLPLVFPLHPRTQAKLAAENLQFSARITVCEPLPYLDFLGLMGKARVVLTDSGGIQEETTALMVPCLTLRSNTERPITQHCGSNRLVGTEPGAVLKALSHVLDGPLQLGCAPPLWDGRAAERIGDILEKWLESQDVLAVLEGKSQVF